MGKVERAVIEALVRAVEAGAPFVSENDLQAVARAAGGRGKAAEFAIARLLRRGLLSSQWNGATYKEDTRLGYRPTAKAYDEL